jgi:hypothetical protein
VKNYTKAYKKLKITTETYECALKTLDLNQNAIRSFEQSFFSRILTKSPSTATASPLENTTTWSGAAGETQAQHELNRMDRLSYNR